MFFGSLVVNLVIIFYHVVYKMALQKLPREIQSLFCASQLCSYKRAVEELVYNALDADSTSIAIRINIEENSIQVIDNGHGISKNDFNLLGQRHATSKCVDLATLKSAPNKYGFRGLSLASVIEVSKSVKIASRCPNSEDTWVKTFYKGKEEKVCEASQRPSKGTTVDVKGFLYNLKIQKQAIESLNELNDLKNFLEQLSLVHNNVSVSLRDDAKNDIIFKLHKNRDIYQTLSSVFEVAKEDIQELSVEKGEYKVTAYIGKRDKERREKRLIYLNKKLLINSKINKIVNDSLTQTLKLNLTTKKNVKCRNPYNKEEDLGKSGIPFYFIFISCPYYDYDLNITSKQTVVEFKQWYPINKLLEKLVKLYAGDINNNKMPIIKTIKDIDKVENTREEVKKIMERILGNNQRKIGISQMQRGIKGKITKRKPKKQTAKLSLSKVIPKNDRSKDINHDYEQCDNKDNSSAGDKKNENNKNLVSTQKIANKLTNSKTPKERCDKNISRLKQSVQNVKQKVAPKKTLKSQVKSTLLKNYKKSIKVVDDKPLMNKNTQEKLKPAVAHKRLDKQAVCNKKTFKTKQHVNKSLKRKSPILDSFVKKFMDDPRGSVRKRCAELSNKVKEMLNLEIRNKRQAFVNETIQYSNIVKGNKKYSVRKKIDEIIIHDYIPKPIGLSVSSYDGRTWYNTNKSPQQEKDNLSSYDLIKTVLRTQDTKNTYTKTVYPETKSLLHSTEYNNYPKSNDTQIDTPIRYISMPKLTYESHNYENYINQISHEYGFISRDEYDDYDHRKKTTSNMRFITTQSRDNFLIPWSNDKTRRKNNKTEYTKNSGYSKGYFGKYNKSMSCASSYTIEFSKSDERATNNFVEHLNNKSLTEPIVNGTYTLDDQNDNWYENCMSPNYGLTYTIIDDTLENINDIKNSSGHQNIFRFDGNKNVISLNRGNYTYNLDSMEDKYDYNNIIELDETNDTQNMDIVFVSKSQEEEPFHKSRSFEKDVIPLELCETVHSCEEHEEPAHGRKNDSLFNDDFEINSSLCDRNAYSQRSFPDFMDLDGLLIDDHLNEVNTGNNDNMLYLNPERHTGNTNIIHPDCLNTNTSIENPNNNDDTESRFHFKDRLRFVPKGMSQIFNNCQSKDLSDYHIGQDYFEKTIYDKFADDVRENTKIYEPEVQNVKELATKAVDKVKNKLSKDHASLIFNGDSLKNAKVLAQIDNKFIAAKLTGRTHQSLELSEYLILFDQHAVHERIRLESNLADYFKNDQWKSTELDEIIIKLPKEEILYLHNYKYKFSQLGLDWTMLNSGEICVKTIPEAILGKNPRQVEVVIKSVKNLIIEEINTMKAQSGCISLYPKAIMELVFSESCRYAIKFGDRLSINQCVELLNSLAECKTPFQCAHGRPVMAVLMELRNDVKKYKVNMARISNWMRHRYN